VRQRITVPASQWQRGLKATQRLGVWLRTWDDRARTLRETAPPPTRPDRPGRPREG
jgi:hypothetical protein